MADKQCSKIREDSLLLRAMKETGFSPSFNKLVLVNEQAKIWIITNKTISIMFQLNREWYTHYTPPQLLIFKVFSTFNHQKHQGVITL